MPEMHNPNEDWSPYEQAAGEYETPFRAPIAYEPPADGVYPPEFDDPPEARS